MVISAMMSCSSNGNLESSASQLSAQRSDEHSLTRSHVSDDDATVEVGSVQLGGAQ
jgi:hypothetical protein